MATSPNASGAAGTAVWEELAQEVLSRNPRGRILVAIDGVDAAARMHFADALAAGEPLRAGTVPVGVEKPSFATFAFPETALAG